MVMKNFRFSSPGLLAHRAGQAFKSPLYYGRKAAYVAKAIWTKKTPLYYGEFGYELICVVPFVHYLAKIKRLEETCGVSNTSPLYFFSPRHTEVTRAREWKLGPSWNSFPYYGRFHFFQWRPPDYKSFFKNQELRFPKPLFIVHNKYTTEWGGPPINYLDLPTLREIFRILEPFYQVVYIRPQSNLITAQGLSDDQENLTLSDHEMIRKEFKNVVLFDDLLIQNPKKRFNEIQFMLHANCDRFVSVQGGNSAIASYFGGKNCIYFKQGEEMRFDSYRKLWPKLSGCEIQPYFSYTALLEALKKIVAADKKNYLS